MAKRGYKLQEFLAHSTNVNCLSIGKKTSRLLITGGDDQKVNLWSIGKPTSLMSLCGHTSPVESVAFNSSEVLVVAGASTGVIKLWDLEEAKMVRGLTGHRSNCTAVEFHPFGEFFASGSIDTNLKIWDIRKKGCIHTYKGHTSGINTIRFTPDGRWVVSGGLDNVVKVWDLTAGKLLHDFKFHEGHIRSLDFHPLEFLLATGSADGTVKFWDLETFELIGSSRPESSGVRAITFHPDGRTLFCGLDDSLKVYSWEPVVCHNSFDMGWSTLGDVCINEGKLLGCSYYQNSVGVWVADTSLGESHGASSITDKNECMEKTFNLPGNESSERTGSGTRSASSTRSVSPDYETKEIKNIYIDSSGGNSTAAKKPGYLSTPKVVLPVETVKVSNAANEKPNAESAGQAVNKSFIVPSIIPRDNDVGKDSSDSGREPISFSRTKPGMLLRPAHIRKTPTKSDNAKLPLAVRSRTGSDKKGGSDSEKESDSQSGYNSDDRGRKPVYEENSTILCITDKFEKALSPEPPTEEINRLLLKPPRIRRSPVTKCNDARRAVSVDSGYLNNRKGGLEYSSDRELEREFITEDRGRKPCDDEGDANIKIVGNKFERTPSPQALDGAVKCSPNRSSESDSVKVVRGVTVVSGRTRSLVERFERRERFSSSEDKAVSVTTNQLTNVPSDDRGGEDTAVSVTTNQPTNVTLDEPHVTVPQPANTIPTQIMPVVLDRATDVEKHKPRPANMIPTQIMPVILDRATDMRKHKRYSDTECKVVSVTVNQPTDVTSDESNGTPPRPANAIPTQKEEPQISGRENDCGIAECLMQTHDAFLSTLQSRLIKLQIVRHFWERNDIKGAIGALKKLPDHSVQADVISVLMDKTEILTLDLCSSLLPILTGLLNSKTERPANVSLEMLLKLVAVFGAVIRATVSAPRIVGVDLHAEQRLQLCNECSAELQKVQKILPELTRRGGFLGRKAQELNLVLQEP